MNRWMTFLPILGLVGIVAVGACTSDNPSEHLAHKSEALEDYGPSLLLDTPNFDSFSLHELIDGPTGITQSMYQDCHVGGGACSLPTGVNSWSEVLRAPTTGTGSESEKLTAAIQVIVGRIITGDFSTGYTFSDPALTALSSINYEVDFHYDSYMDRVLIVLRQKPHSSGGLDYLDNSDPTRSNRGRNWGTFVFNEKPSNWTVVEAPHNGFDESTDLMAVDAFEKGDCLALMVAGTHRYAVDHPTGSVYGQADVAHAPGIYSSSGGAGELSGFNTVHRAILTAAAGDVPLNIVQLHGYSEATHGYLADAVVSSSVFSTRGHADTAQVDNFFSKRLRTAIEGAYVKDQNPLATPTPAKEFKPDTGTAILEGSQNLQAYDASNSNAAWRPPVPVLFSHVEMPQCIRLKDYHGTNCNYLGDDVRLHMARQITYAADDAQAEIEYSLLPSKDAVGIRDCRGSAPHLGWDSNIPPASADGNPEHGSNDTIQRAYTLQAIAHNSPLRFVGFQLDSPRVTGSPLCLATAAGRWAGNQRRPLLERLGLRVVPLWFGPLKTTGCGASNTAVDIDTPTLGVNDGATEAGLAYNQVLTEGFGTGTGLFLDIEQSSSISSYTNLKTYIADWFTWFSTHNTAGIRLGVYCGPSNCSDIAALTAVPSTTMYWAHDGRCTTGTSVSPGCSVDHSVWSSLWPSTHAQTGSTTLKALFWQYAQDPNADSVTSCAGYVADTDAGVYLCKTPSYGDYATFYDQVDLSSFDISCPHDGVSAATRSPIGEYLLRFPESSTYTNDESTINNLVVKTQPTQTDFDTAASTVGVDSLTMRAWRQLYRAGAARMLGSRLATDTRTGILPNGGFENDLSRWTTLGTAGTVTTPLSGAKAAQIGSTAPTQVETSSLTRAFTAPANGGTLTISYKIVCNDTVTYDQFWITLQDLDTNAGYTILSYVCSNTGSWSTIRYSLASVAGDRVVLTLSNHDDGLAGDPTYTLIDDVAVEAAVNGSFEMGSLSNWSSSGSTSVQQPGYAGAFSARVGTTTPTNTSSLSQTFLVPAGSGTLSFDYLLTCPDNIIYDHFSVTLTDVFSQTSFTVLGNTCTNTAVWNHVTYALDAFAGHDVTLTFTNVDDNYPGDPTHTDIDNVVILY